MPVNELSEMRGEVQFGGYYFVFIDPGKLEEIRSRESCPFCLLVLLALFDVRVTTTMSS
jgi:hypothetical protein